uniref:PDZ domain-containing protein n=1 Tax=Romanomermis culicivorax TaxID=13658 RepID=A0A915JFD3_ROMCU
MKPLTDRLLNEVVDRLRSKSLELFTSLAVWSTDLVTVEVHKGNKGLGLSVLDYQDPLHPKNTVIVVRSLVPGGAAAMTGSIVPGDRILSVNNVDLTHATLEKAFNALKMAPKGTVKIELAKPLPLVDD